MVGRYLRATPGFFCCQREDSVVGKEIARNAVVQLPGLHTCSFFATKLENSPRREELWKLRPKPMEAHLPCPVGNLRKAVVENLLAS